MKPELRYLSAAEVRAVGGTNDKDPARIEGYAVVYNAIAELPGFRERVLPGACKRAVDEGQDVVCLFNHNTSIVLGRTSAGTLRLREDPKGLFFSCDIPETQGGRDAYTSIKRKDVRGCSFAFLLPGDGKAAQSWYEEKGSDGKYFIQRDIRDMDMQDVSPCTYPAYSQTEISARSYAAEAPAELRSAVDLKNSELIKPPVLEKRSCSVDEVPNSVPKEKRKQWMEVWNKVYKRALDAGKPPAEAEKSGIAEANDAVKERAKFAAELRAILGIDDSQINTQDCPNEWPDATKKAYCDGYNAAYEKARAEGLMGKAAVTKAVAAALFAIHELDMGTPSGSEQPPAKVVDTDKDGDEGQKIRSQNSFEDTAREINDELVDQFPATPEQSASQYSAPACCGRFWAIETYSDHVIACEWGSGDTYYSIPYTTDDQGKIKFGEPVPVEKEWVPSDRSKAAVTEFRSKLAVKEQPKPVWQHEEFVAACDRLKNTFEP